MATYRKPLTYSAWRTLSEDLAANAAAAGNNNNNDDDELPQEDVGTPDTPEPDAPEGMPGSDDGMVTLEGDGGGGGGDNTFLWKPASENNGRLVVLTPNKYNGKIKNVTLVGPNGQNYGTGKFTGDEHNGRRGHWRFNAPGGAYPPGTRVAVNFDGGGGVFYTVRNTGARNSGLQENSFKDFGDLLSGDAGVVAPEGGPGNEFAGDTFLPPGVSGGGSGGLSAFPYYNPNYPTFNPVDFNNVKFNNIEQAPFNFTDPQKFAEGFGEFNRQQVSKNFAQSQGMALGALNTELEGLKFFVPAASALKREQTSIDNQFNQAEREKQVNQALPHARADLEEQRQRSRTYTSGELPDEQADRALELGTRSRAADTGTFAGFGAGSSQTAKIGDLMSAEQRFQISQYGEQLGTQNRQETAGLFLAPTSYSDAGQQIRVNPEVGAGRLTYQGLGALNEATLVSPGQALNTVVQQEQFKTNLDQRTREFNTEGTFRADTFNSTGNLQKDMFNSSGQFAADLGKFQYDVGYLASLQAANQGNLNGAIAIGMGGINNQNFGAGFDSGKFMNSMGSFAEAVGGAAAAVNGNNTVLNDTDTPPPSSTSEPVGGTNVDTAANNQGGGGGQQMSSGGGEGERIIPATSGGGGGPQFQAPQQAPAAIPMMGGDSSISGGARFSQGSPAPQGYTPVANNNDGTYTAIKNSDYATELDRFSRYAGIPSQNINLRNIAIADKTLANSAALSYTPTQGFKPISTLPNGRQVYSLPAAAESGDNTVGSNNLNNTGLMAAYLSVGDTEMYNYLSKVSNVSSSPESLDEFDRISTEEGADGLADAIINKLLDGKADPETPEGQQVIAGAMRISELWSSLSPAQKSLSISSLAQPATQIKTGKNIPDQVVWGTENSRQPLKVRDVARMNDRGANGMGIARNWGQLSNISRILVDVDTPDQVAAVSTQTGMAGYGPQGAAVPVSAKYLSSIKAAPAPEYGVGAVSVQNAGRLPKGYKVVTKTPDGNIIALPANLAESSTFSADTIAPLAYKNTQLITNNQHPAQKLWGKAPSGGVIRGAAGGSALVSSLNTMARTSPYMYSGVAAYSLFETTLA